MFIFSNKEISVLANTTPSIVLSDELRIGLIERLSISSGKDFAFGTFYAPSNAIHDAMIALYTVNTTLSTRAD